MDQSQFSNILSSDVALGKKKKKSAVISWAWCQVNLSREVLFLGFTDEEMEV